MRMILGRLQSFAMFDLPFEISWIQQSFVTIHENYSKAYQGWSLNATRKKLVADYWLKHVLAHLGAFYLTGLVIVLFLGGKFDEFVLSGVLLGVLISLPVLIFWLYGQLFYFDFLPKLDTIMENYEGKQLLHLKKCQQAQMSNFALAVVYYALAKASGLQITGANRQYGERLMNLFGKDPDDMYRALKLIACKVSKLSPHKQTEIGKSLEEARSFFELIEFLPGIKVVEQLDSKLMTL
ncbi:hypothetical protein HF329_33400 [Chitinophaga oryzae]|uniref:Uncharacterized protein n=1 Tax=Chitinophaga oryzae TaxID=2725414 RepID=A0AAE6ZQK7_9BACT|nr:hypothetical protein [Chitinophaga oryzae]QJB35945.1 hypothetical protein HF329_33400 [Chitinophaga oryzae]